MAPDRGLLGLTTRTMQDRWNIPANRLTVPNEIGTYIGINGVHILMSKYSPLGAYLRQQRRDVVSIKFAEIEKIIGSKLPASARYRAWWSNNDFNSVLTKVWLEAGFKSEQVDMAKHKLIFRRVRKPQAADAAGPAAGETPFHPLYGAMQGLVRIMPGTDLTQPADPEWADRLDAAFGKERREQ